MVDCSLDRRIGALFDSRCLSDRPALATSAARPVGASTDLTAQIAFVARQLSLTRPPECRTTTATIVPFVLAIRRPVLLLPETMLQTFSVDERASIIAHELAHLRRGDHLVRWLQLAVTAMYWWHPIAWLASRRVSRSAELCCDALVASRFPDRVHEYGSALFKTIELFSGPATKPPAPAMAFGHGRFLKRRFEMILRNRFTYRLSRPAWLLIALASACVLPLSLHRSWADEATDSKSGSELGPKSTAAQTTAKLPDSDVQKRLDRLEAMLAELIEQSKRGGSAARSRATLTGDSPRTNPPADESIQPRKTGSRAERTPEESEKTPSNIESRLQGPLEEVFRDFEANESLQEDHYNRMKAAERQVETVGAAYENGTVTLDLLLDAQRRLVDAEVEYAKATVTLTDPSLSPASKMTLQLLTLKSAKKGRKMALETWKKVHALYATGSRGGEAEKEAQAREQYFYFREYVQKTLIELLKSMEKQKAIEKSGPN